MSEELLTPLPFTLEEVRNKGALAGFGQLNKTEALDLLKKDFEAHKNKNLDHKDQNIEIYNHLQKRFENIIREVEPRKKSATSRVDELVRRGMNRGTTKLLGWVGGLSLPALSWTISWLIYESLQQFPKTGEDESHINDLVGLFSEGFRLMKVQLIKAAPFAGQQEWIFLAIGLILTLVGLKYYLSARHMEPDKYLINIKIDLKGQTEPQTFFSYIKKIVGSRSPKERTADIIKAILFGLPGIGMVLGYLNAASLDIIFVGFAMAAVTVAIMIFILQISLNKSDSGIPVFFPKWVYNSFIFMTILTFAVFFVVIVLRETHEPSISATALGITFAGLFLIIGSASLAASEMQKGIYADETYLLRLMAQLENRIIDCKGKINEIQGLNKLHETYIENEWARIKMEFEQAYELAAKARTIDDPPSSGLLGWKKNGAYWNRIAIDSNDHKGWNGKSRPKNNK